MRTRTSSSHPISVLSVALLLGACDLESEQDASPTAFGELQIGEDELGVGDGDGDGDGDIIGMCGDGIVEGDEECDVAGESAECDGDCTFPTCGDGYPNLLALEQCDDGNQDNTDGCTTMCESAVCGDGHVWEGHEACDGNQANCNDDCTLDDACSWDIDAAPLPVAIHAGASSYGQIAFDRNCDLLVTGEHTQQLFRLSRVDGTVSSVGVIVSDSMHGLTAHPDGRVYIGVSTPNELWALEPDDSLTKIADLPANPLGLTVAPPGFGAYGGQIIWGGGAKIHATDPANGVTSVIGQWGNGMFADVAFAPNGTLYTVQESTSRIFTVTAAGVFVQFADLPSLTDALLVNADGTKLHVVNFSGAASIDSLSIPGAVKVEGPEAGFNGGSYPSGIEFDATGRLLYLAKIPWNGPVSVGSFVP